MQTNRTTVFIVCLVYLVGLAFLLNAMSETFVSNKYSKGVELNYTTTSQSLGFDINFLGMHVGLGDSFLGNVVISISTLPIWFNTLFIIIPSVLMVVFGILMFIPTIPSG